MPPRSTQRMPRGTPRHAITQRPQNYHLHSSEVQRKSRRIARKVGEAGPSGWKHAEDGDERDLVPPSDVEEYEIWKKERAESRERREADEESALGDSSTQSHEDFSSSGLRPSQLSRSRVSFWQGSQGSNSPPTSPTVALGSSQLFSNSDRAASRDLELTSEHDEFDADDDDDAWPHLVTSEELNHGLSKRHPQLLQKHELLHPAPKPSLKSGTQGSEVGPDEYESPPSNLTARLPSSSPANDSPYAMPSISVNTESWIDLNISNSPETHGIASHGPVARLWVESVQNNSDFSSDHGLRSASKQQDGEVIGPVIDAVSIIPFTQEIEVQPVRPTDDASEEFLPDLLATPKRPLRIVEDSPALPSSTEKPHVVVTTPIRSALGSLTSLTPNGHDITTRQRDDQNGSGRIATKAVRNRLTFTPSPSPFLSQKRDASQQEQSNSPLVEAQVGPHNQPEWRKARRSSSRTPTRMNTAIPPSLDIDTPSLPDLSHANASFAHASLPSAESNLLLPLAHARELQAVAQRPLPQFDISSEEPPSRPPADPALERFRTARTFRTRTVLQLRPYTKEKQIYEEALRKGGLKKGKHAIAREREISSSEVDNDPEGDEEASTAADDNEPERIVIGDTPPVSERAKRKPRRLVDEDYDDYFIEYGVAAQDDDAECEAKLQEIARRRIKAAKLERKRQREAEKTRREFERFMRRGIRGTRSKTNEPDPSSTSPARPADITQSVRQTTVSKPKTYGKRDRLIAPANAPHLKSALDRPNIRSAPVVPSSANRLRSSSTRSTTRFQTPAIGTVSPDETPSPMEQDLALDHDNNSILDHGDDMDYGLDVAENLSTPTIAVSPKYRRGESSFLIDDLGRDSTTRRYASTSSDSEPAASDAAENVLDKRQKIARRMMPAAMLQRLEREAAQKAKERERKRQGADRVRSPARPGRAIVRKGDRNGDVEDLLGFIGSDVESIDSAVNVDRLLTPTPAVRQRELILISDDSDGVSSSSQAYEDNTGAQTLARLYDGDFETIIAGRKPSTRDDPRNRRRPTVKEARSRRPRMGFATRNKPTPVRKSKTMHQARLDLPVDERSPSSRNTSAKKRKHAVARPQYKRPAIRLDDQTIYADADFAFDEGSDEASITSQPKRLKHTPSKVNTAAITDNVDAGIGRGRSWANFDKFSVDFGISPLPSGLHCSPDSYVGSGQLSCLIDHIRGKNVDMVLVPSVSAYGVELRNDMPSAAIESVVTVLVSAIRDGALGYANDTLPDAPKLDPLGFLGSYLSCRKDEMDGDLMTLRSSCRQAVISLSDSLDGLHEVNGGRSRPVREALLSLRIALLDLACRIDSPPSVDGARSVITCATSLLHQLLSFGFDKSVKPLKKLMKGNAETPEISELTTTAWIAVMHILDARSQICGQADQAFLPVLERAIGTVFRGDETGPIAAERIWFLIFGLCALSQFCVDGLVGANFVPAPRWQLVKRAIGLIKISHSEEAEERAHIEQLRGRDRYIKSMIARCVRLSAVWKWSFDRGNFSVATKDLGVIFKDRQHRNLPTESPVDFPEFITHFDMTLTAAEEDRRESAFELYLRLVCVAASDVISSAQSLSEAQKAERDVQRLIMSIIPVSPVKFSRILPPTLRQLGQLVNRYSTMIAACYFSPSLLPWLLANSQKWIAFDTADFESRQVSIRGLMYLAVACRHHGQSLDKVVDCLAHVLSTLQKELDENGKPSVPVRAPSRLEIERTMVLVVACFRQIIEHHSYDPEAQANAVYPDPCLLHHSWTSRVFALDLANDLKCGLEVVATIQAFLDARANALPRIAKQRREGKKKKLESQDEYSFGIDFSTVDLIALGGEAASLDPVQQKEEDFATIITTIISPKIYRLLSDMLPPIEDETLSEKNRAERQLFIGKLTKCWSDCVGVIVVEQNSEDGWTPYIGTFGRESWQRFRNEAGRLHVGLQFMLSVAAIDPGCFEEHQEVFLTLLFPSIVTDKLTIEHKFLSALLAMPHVLDAPLFSQVAHSIPHVTDGFDRTRFIEDRPAILEAIFSAIPLVLGSSHTATSTKSLIYRCVNLLVSAMVQNEKAIQPHRVIHKESYHAFVVETSRSLLRLAGEFISTTSVPGLKAFV